MTFLTKTKTIRAAIATGLIMNLAALAACHKQADKEPVVAGDDAIVRVGDAILTRPELQHAMPANLSQADSAAFADAYVRTWISDNLISEIAVRNVGNTEEIDRLTDEYRKSLIMWEYRRRVVESDTSMQVTDADIKAYYDSHLTDMRLRHPMIRGIYIKIESDAPALKDVKRWYKSPKQDDIEQLEKVGLHGAIHYDYFRDLWIPWEQIITKIPHEISESDLRKGYTLDVQSNGFTYLLSVSDILPAGAKIPYEAAAPRIRETLEAVRLTEIDEELRRRLYQQAQEAGEIEFF